MKIAYYRDKETRNQLIENLREALDIAEGITINS